jgi:hypothetical protein
MQQIHRLLAVLAADARPWGGVQRPRMWQRDLTVALSRRSALPGRERPRRADELRCGSPPGQAYTVADRAGERCGPFAPADSPGESGEFYGRSATRPAGLYWIWVSAWHRERLPVQALSDVLSLVASPDT